jgi:hypothetical protein
LIRAPEASSLSPLGQTASSFCTGGDGGFGWVDVITMWWLSTDVALAQMA